jgi:hypothetical protein
MSLVLFVLPAAGPDYNSNLMLTPKTNFLGCLLIDGWTMGFSVTTTIKKHKTSELKTVGFCFKSHKV